MFYFSFFLILLCFVKPRTLSSIRVIKSKLLKRVGESLTSGWKTVLPPFTSELLLSIFYTLLVFNLAGLFVYIPPVSRQLFFSIPLGVTLFVTCLLISFKMNKIKVLFENLPNRTPQALIRFIGFVEFIRKVIRPVTLAVRLTANITAGNILIHLVTVRPKCFLLQFFLLFFLFLLEFLVGIIQRYVFIMLANIYICES